MFPALLCLTVQQRLTWQTQGQELVLVSTYSDDMVLNVKTAPASADQKATTGADMQWCLLKAECGMRKSVGASQDMAAVLGCLASYVICSVQMCEAPPAAALSRLSGWPVGRRSQCLAHTIGPCRCPGRSWTGLSPQNAASSADQHTSRQQADGCSVGVCCKQELTWLHNQDAEQPLCSN